MDRCVDIFDGYIDRGVQVDGWVRKKLVGKQLYVWVYRQRDTGLDS